MAETDGESSDRWQNTLSHKFVKNKYSVMPQEDMHSRHSQKYHMIYTKPILSDTFM